MMNRLREVPPWVWIAVTAAAGLAVLTYHRFAQDDSDPHWQQIEQPPTTASLLPEAPTGHDHVCAPMATCCGFRSRSYAPSLTHASFSIVGEVN